MELVDTHCHLQFDSYVGRLDEIITAAGSAGVERLVCVGTGLRDSVQAIDIAQKYENVWASVGVHPHEAAAFTNDKNSTKTLRQLIGKPKVVAVGEIGLDYYKDYSPRSAQIETLKQQLECGIPSGLPFIFHVREAFDEFWPIFDSYPNIKGVIHSFSSNPKTLDDALSRGLHIALNGIMTFTHDKQQLEAAKKVPLNRLLLETDAPFLTPQAFRGETCEPKHLSATAEFLAKLRGEKLDEMAATTTANAVELFGIGR